MDERAVQASPVELPQLRGSTHLEGWHSRLKKVVGKSHPNIYELVDVFKREETSTKMKMLEAGAQQAPR